jgi:glutamate dehydrogenase/leucine dehydrogenase
VSSAAGSVWDAYAAFLRRPPEMVLTWNDPLSEATGWLVLNSGRGGAAGGGTRMRRGLGLDEVVYLAKIMELKFALSGPAIGGGKSGIDFDPSDPRRRDVLARWFAAIEPFLRARYGTAGDLNVDEARDVVPLCHSVGIRHPQEGIARGHFGLSGQELESRLTSMEDVLHGPPDAGRAVPGADGLQVIDLVTGYGVARSALRLLERQGRDPAETPTLVEGFGNVGGAATWYLAEAGVPIAGIVDATHALVPAEPLGAREVAELLALRTRNTLPVGEGHGPAERARFGEARAAMYVAAAASGTLDAAAIDSLEERGVEILACGANRPFAAEAPGDTRLEESADGRFAVIPDVIANCGAARAFYHVMRSERPTSPAEVFDSVAGVIEAALDDAIERAGSARRGLLAATLGTLMERAASEGGDPA